MVREESLTETEEAILGSTGAWRERKPVQCPRSGGSQQRDVPSSRKDVSMAELGVCLAVSPPSCLLDVPVGFSHT